MGTMMELPLSATTLRPRDENWTEGLVDDTPIPTFNPLAKRASRSIMTEYHR